MSTQTYHSEEETKIEVDYGYAYTPWRRFLAWVGFITLIVLTLAVIGYLIWSNHLIDTNLYAFR